MKVNVVGIFHWSAMLSYASNLSRAYLGRRRQFLLKLKTSKRAPSKPAGQSQTGKRGNSAKQRTTTKSCS